MKDSYDSLNALLKNHNKTLNIVYLETLEGTKYTCQDAQTYWESPSKKMYRLKLIFVFGFDYQ